MKSECSEQGSEASLKVYKTPPDKVLIHNIFKLFLMFHSQLHKL